MGALGAFEPDNLYEGDALLLMSRFRKVTVDLIVTDPPLPSILPRSGSTTTGPAAT